MNTSKKCRVHQMDLGLGLSASLLTEMVQNHVVLCYLLGVEESETEETPTLPTQCLVFVA